MRRLAIALAIGFGVLCGTAQAKYTPTLTISWPNGAPAFESPFIVSGCGYNSAFGGVTIVQTDPYAISFAGQEPNAAGCISLSNFDSYETGTYTLEAFQLLHGSHQTRVAETSFTL